MDPELLSLDDLPAEARQLIDETEQEITRQGDEARRRAEEIRARAERSASDLEAGAEERARALRRQLLGQLKPLQDRYAREGKLDQALAIRERVRELKAALLSAEPDPGSLSMYSDRPAGTSLLFDVTGSTDGGFVWGTDVYTADSALAAAAVHAGVLRNGERGVVRVTFVDTLNVSFTGSYRHGVESEPFGHWPSGYRLARG